MSRTRTITPFASAARTATESSGAESVAQAFDEATLFVDVTAVAGTSPTLAISYEVSPDNGTTWFTHTTGATITAAGKQVVHLTNLCSTSRLTATIGGTTPSFTFSAYLAMKRRG